MQEQKSAYQFTEQQSTMADTQTGEEIAALEAWIRAGAPIPEERILKDSHVAKPGDYQNMQKLLIV